MMDIGFVGLGHMGLPMACNLIKAGHRVTGFDLQPEALETFKNAGGYVAQNLSQTAQDKDVLVTMLQNAAQVLQVTSQEDGLFNHSLASSLYIDSSTIDVHSSRLIHAKAKEHNLLAVDAPVSGGVAAASSAALTFMVGGSEEAYQRAFPILKAMGKNIIHTGANGSGMAAKICNNMILGISMCAISEAFILAEKLGLHPNKLFEVVNNSSGQCWALSKYVPLPGILANVPANDNYKPGFASAMMLKDLLLSQKEAHDAKLSCSLGAKACELYEELVNEGYGDADFSIIIKKIRELG